MKIPIAQVRENPYNSREDLGDLGGLSKQISKFGLLTPLPVRKTKGGYELAFGSRRLAALRSIGENDIEVSVHDFSDKDMMALSIGENIHRKDLTPAEQARAYEKGVRVAGGIKELSEAISMAQSNIERYLNILKLPAKILKKDTEIGISKLYDISRLVGYNREIFESALQTLENNNPPAALFKEIVTGCKIICDTNLPSKTKINLCHQVLFEDYSKLGPLQYTHASKFAEELLQEAVQEYTKKLEKTKKGREALKRWAGAHHKVKRVDDIIDYDFKLKELTTQLSAVVRGIRQAHSNHYYTRASVQSRNYFKRWTNKLFKGLEELVQDEEKTA